MDFLNGNTEWSINGRVVVSSHDKHVTTLEHRINHEKVVVSHIFVQMTNIPFQTSQTQQKNKQKKTM